MIVRIEEIYTAMETAYDKVAAELDFSCRGCPDNCCDSYFLHHTYIEWSYLWLGVGELDNGKQQQIFARAHDYVIRAERDLQQGRRPQIMCPLNENGLCIIYKHRLMVCRTHGVPATLTRPDGKMLRFPGCFRCQEQRGENKNTPVVERTPMLQRLAILENDYLNNQRQRYPRVKLNIAEMLVKGPPALQPEFKRSPGKNKASE